MIRTIQEMWDKAIEYHGNGDFDTDAMYKIYNEMDPRLTYQDIANVMSGVYADTYWNITYMDYTILSKHLTQALGLASNNANTYAQNAVSQWRGVLARNNINDTGIIPTGGTWTESIDIVCNQDTALFPTQLIKDWNNQFWKTPQVGKNYINVRCQNKAFMGNITPSVTMFYTTAGLNQAPSSWVQLYTADSTNPTGVVDLLDGKHGPMGNGVRGASEAFFFEPKSNDHVCIIGALRSEFFTKNTPTQITGNWNSQQYITCNGASVWHNVDPQMDIESKLKIYNQDGIDENFSFIAQCKNVPKGSKISLVSDDPKVKFDTGEIKIINSSQIIKITTTLPAYYEGDLIVRMEDPDGKLLPSESSVEVTMLWNLKQGHEHYLDGIKQLGNFNALLSLQSIELPMGSFTFLGNGN